MQCMFIRFTVKSGVYIGSEEIGSAPFIIFFYCFFFIAKPLT